MLQKFVYLSCLLYLHSANVMETTVFQLLFWVVTGLVFLLIHWNQQEIFMT